MSELVARASNILVQRIRTAQRKSIEAAETYSKLVLDPDGDPALAETLVEAMDELGIGSKELNEDLVHLRLARKVVPRIQAQREASRRAHQDVRAAELALHVAQGTRCPQPIERAHYELDEAIGRAADAQREAEALLEELRERCRKIERVVRGQVQSVEAAMVEADARREQRDDMTSARREPPAAADSPQATEAVAQPPSTGSQPGGAENAGNAPVVAAETARSENPRGKIDAATAIRNAARSALSG